MLLTILVIYVTMVYGPIAAMLVELFPTRIRYTSMSLPYHIGNGWFGGFLPTTAFAIVAATGDIYYGLWYPIVVAVMTFVIGMLLHPRDQGSLDHRLILAVPGPRRSSRRGFLSQSTPGGKGRKGRREARGSPAPQQPESTPR